MHINQLINSNKKSVIAAVVLLVLTATMTAFALKALNGVPDNSGQEQNGKEQLVENAETTVKSAEHALSKGEFKEAAEKLEEAKEMYAEAGNDQEAAQVNDTMKSIDPEAIEEPSSEAEDAPMAPVDTPQPAPMPW